MYNIMSRDKFRDFMDGSKPMTPEESEDFLKKMQEAFKGHTFIPPLPNRGSSMEKLVFVVSLVSTKLVCKPDTGDRGFWLVYFPSHPEHKARFSISQICLPDDLVDYVEKRVRCLANCILKDMDKPVETIHEG